MKYIVLSVNENQDYRYFMPLVQWSWKRIGWEVIILDTTNIIIPEGYRSDTIAQISRLYAAIHLHPNDMVMTGDIDMIALSDYWHPDPNKISCYGHDLTGHTHFPICYIAMTAKKWCDVMELKPEMGAGHCILRDLNTLPQAKEEDFYKRWFTDQDLITERLEPFKNEIVSIERGQYPNGYACGRVDRGAWSLSHSEFIDCHMHHQIHHKGNEWKFEQTLEMLYHCFPGEDFKWFIDYTLDFKKQHNQL